MVDKEQFRVLVTEAYAHLYDMVYLRTHLLADLLITDPAIRRKEKAQRLHHLLLDVIDELYPGPQAPISSREWRRHRLLVSHFVDGLDPQMVANELNISRRHFYREQETALEAIAEILWHRCLTEPGPPAPASAPEEPEAPSHRMELLRLETARLSQNERYASLYETIQGVAVLLKEMLQKQDLELAISLPRTLPRVTVSLNLLRQLLLGVFGFLIKWAENGAIKVAADVEETSVGLSVLVEPTSAVLAVPQEEAQNRLAVFQEMAGLGKAGIEPVHSGNKVTGFHIRLPTTIQ